MFVLRLISFLPLGFLYLLSDFFYLIARYLIRYRAKVIDKNLLYAFPEKTHKERKEIKNRFYRNFTDSFAEILKLLTMSEAELQRRVKIKNLSLVTDLIDDGKVVIGVQGHFFNWEAHLLGASWFMGNQAEVVYLKLNNAFSDKLMKTIRGRFNASLIERNAFQRDFLRRRDEPRLIVLAADQRPVHAEVRYKTLFMNRETAFFEGAEKLAKRFANPVVYGYCKKEKRGHYSFTYSLIAEPPYADTPDHSITDEFILRTEDNIRQEPDLYLWSHNRWKE
ncbi:lysophospholipid acyltransferase family protein [Pararhodonellum marinum]|uniref:lysophospholipid acyltransferase family protein n=1 Tax=Pararhodonellum marinum TaxID=2755358 RepID=UPI00188FE3FA|nr:lysophospholipid acyltransferase family protein [Pararhodonellum marinum]